MTKKFHGEANMLCRYCLIDKPPSGFYYANKSRCHDCIKAAAIAYRQANLERVRAYDRLRGSLPHRVAARKEYKATEQGKQAHKRSLKAHALRFPNKTLARIALGNAVRDGRVLPWPVCAVPECSGKPQAHHPDYSAPLSVVWLCDPHHKAVHAATKELESAWEKAA